MSKCVWQRTRINGVDCLIPFDRDSETRLADFKINEPVTGDISGSRNPRSLDQLHLYWKACSVVAENTTDKSWNTRDKVDWQIRNWLKFYDYDNTYVNGPYVNFSVRSISFANLKHTEACDYFNKAFDIMAEFLEVETEVFIQEVKRRIGGSRD